MSWTIVADSSGARVFEGSSLSRKLTLLAEIQNADASKQNRDLRSDRPGRSFDSFSHSRHSMAEPVDPKTQLSRKFSKTLAHELNQARIAKKFDRLILVAEAQFLGELRKALDKNTLALVVDTLPRDLTHFSVEELNEHLRDKIHL